MTSRFFKTVWYGKEIKVPVTSKFEMWRQWDPLEKSTWNLPSGSAMLIIKSDRYCADKLEKTLFPLIVLCLLWYSASIQWFLQVLFPDCTFFSQVWYKSPDLDIQRSLCKLIYLFTVPKVLPLLAPAGWREICWGYRAFRLLPSYVKYKKPAMFVSLSGMVYRDMS